MRHLSKQIFESFFRRLTEYRQKGRIYNATYGTGVIGSFHGKSPVSSSCFLCARTIACVIASAKSSDGKTSGGAWICHHSSVYCSGIAQNPEGVLPFCIYFIQTRCKSVFGEGQTVVGCENVIVGDFDVFSFLSSRPDGRDPASIPGIVTPNRLYSDTHHSKETPPPSS